MGVALPDPAFLDVVVIDFGVSEADSHYHVPLLVSPFGYSTYRGS
jgi:5-hydroxyisourate hydrolase